MATMTKRPHRAALTRMLRATGLAHMPEEAPLVALLRMLADELDAGTGGERSRAAYLSALKDARRVLAAAPARPKSRQDPKGPEEQPDLTVVAAEAAAAEPAATSLAAFRQKRGIA